MASLNSRLNIESANESFFKNFDRTSAEVCGRSIYDLLHPSVRALLSSHFSYLLNGYGSRFGERVVAMRGNGRVFSAEMAGIAVQGEDDGRSGVVVLVSPDDEVGDSWENNSRVKSILTPLDAHILEGVAAGVSTVRMAAGLYLSRQGVEYHVGLMLRRFKAPNRAALVSRAYAMGVLTVGSWPPRVVPDFVK
jgi:DNA-binding CsgD family transcriptional regulator